MLSLGLHKASVVSSRTEPDWQTNIPRALAGFMSWRSTALGPSTTQLLSGNIHIDVEDRRCVNTSDLGRDTGRSKRKTSRDARAKVCVGEGQRRLSAAGALGIPTCSTWRGLSPTPQPLRHHTNQTIHALHKDLLPHCLTTYLPTYVSPQGSRGPSKASRLRQRASTSPVDCVSFLYIFFLNQRHDLVGTVSTAHLTVLSLANKAEAVRASDPPVPFCRDHADLSQTTSRAG